jgi:predicted Ser/Thr protein kinase
VTDEQRERELANALADYLDRGDHPTGTIPELTAELDALAGIDRVLEPPAALPDKLSGHRIVAEIGSGGMGRVLLAEDQALGRKVAIKTLAPRYAENPVLRARFMHEARAMARVSHPNVVRIYRLGEADEPPHFVMEFVDGAPLTRAAARLTFDQKAELMHKVALAAQFLHDHGIIHRDLKPGNILAGPDLEPKLLDFGLALDLGGQERLSKIGEIAGTPEYLSPEQAAGAEKLDARTDVFSLGSVLYELLTGAPPFGGDTVGELLRRIREEDAELPRRRNPEVPQALQNVCMKALEKDPALRYGSARELADDLRRFLAGEPVLAAPAVYGRMIARKVGEHLSDLEGWRHDRILTDGEYDGIRKRYDRLVEREDAWILEARRLTVPQVTLYFGSWVLAVAAALLTCYHYPALDGAPAVLIAWGAALPLVRIGRRDWLRGARRVGIAYLMAFCMIVPIAALVTFEEARWFTAFTRGRVDLELFHKLEFPKQATNTQLWWALLLAVPACWWMRRFTRAPVFSLMLAALGASLCGATLLRMGLLDWIEHDPGRPYFYLMPCAALFMAAGLILERLRLPDDSRYFYPIAVGLTWAALTGVVAFHEPYAQWLKSVAPWTRGQIAYLYILNAGVYFLLDRLCDRADSQQVRMVGKAFRFVLPGHILISLLALGLEAKSPAETKLFVWLLPFVAGVFVFASIWRQMKNFFVSGLAFFAVGVFRLQQEIFSGRAGWPLILLVAGLGLMTAAGNYSAIRVAIQKKFRR